MNRLISSVILVAILFFVSCSEEKVEIKEQFSTPEKTYRLWIETAEREDIPANMACLTDASKRLMDKQLQQLDEFMRRLKMNVAIFKSYTVSDHKVKDDRAVVILKGPKEEVIAVPLMMEAEGWKIDMIALFGGTG